MDHRFLRRVVLAGSLANVAFGLLTIPLQMAGLWRPMLPNATLDLVVDFAIVTINAFVAFAYRRAFRSAVYVIK